MGNEKRISGDYSWVLTLSTPGVVVCHWLKERTLGRRRGVRKWKQEKFVNFRHVEFLY